MLLGTEAPPVPAASGRGAPQGPSVRKGLAVPPGGRSPSALDVVLLLPKLTRALFGWLRLMAGERSLGY